MPEPLAYPDGKSELRRGFGVLFGGLVLGGVLLSAMRTFGSSTAIWGDGFVRGVSTALGLAALVSLVAWRAGPLARRITALVVLAGYGAVLVARLGGWQPRLDWWPDLRLVAAAVAGVFVASVGLAARRRWARWLAIGLGLAAGGSAAVSLAFDPTLGAWTRWASAATLVAAALIVVDLVGSAMAADDVDDRDDFTQTWPDRIAAVRWLRLAMIVSVAAVPVLLAYAWVELDAVRGLRMPAVGLAALLAGGVIAVVNGRSHGTMMIGAAGVGLWILAVAAIAGIDDPSQRTAVMPYLAAWIVAGGAALVCGATLVRAAGRLARGD